MNDKKPIKTLDVTAKQEVSYCVPIWLRDEQIKQSITRVKGRIQPAKKTDAPIAVVGFGPSLVDTWEQVRNFKYIISCSGAHKFLIERGIIPTLHVDVDPRPHKVALLGPPHPDVEYLAASTCSPKYFDHLEKGLGKEVFDQHVKLWHVFDASEDGSRLLPAGEWSITGGCDAGLRALTIAGFLGFRDIHVFGLDGSAREAKHAADHPNKIEKFSEVEHGGKTFKTTPGLLAAAQQIWHELDSMPAVHATFYGEGLIQSMAKTYVQKPLEDTRLTNVVGIVRPETISPEYAALNEKLHYDNLAYGVGGGKYAPTVLKLSETLKTTSVLDYGCGKAMLAKALPFPIWCYDPAVPKYSETPRPADIVICTDVLEHVEPDRVNFVLSDLRRVTKKVAYVVIHTGPSGKTLADGRNAHILQQDGAWWKKKLKKYFTVGKMMVQGPLVHFVLAPKDKAKMAGIVATLESE